MNSRLKVSWLTAAALLAQPGVVASQQGQITNYESKDNLKSFHHLDCIDATAVKSEYTPADIYPAAKTCVDQEDFARAARLFAIAGVYGRFDTLRVADVSAHQAIAVLQLNFFGQLDGAAKEKLQTTVRAIAGSDQLAQTCALVRKLGPPTYYPTYMTQHGMSAFTGQGGGLKKEFNASEAWASSLADYLHCPAPPGR